MEQLLNEQGIFRIGMRRGMYRLLEGEKLVGLNPVGTV